MDSDLWQLYFRIIGTIIVVVVALACVCGGVVGYLLAH